MLVADGGLQFVYLETMILASAMHVFCPSVFSASPIPILFLVTCLHFRISCPFKHSLSVLDFAFACVTIRKTKAARGCVVHDNGMPRSSGKKTRDRNKET